MMAGVEVGFVWIGSLGEHLVELLRADFETVLVFGSAVEVDFHAIEFLCIHGQSHWIVRFPVGQILEKNGAVSAHGSEHIRMFHRNLESPVAAHRYPADSASYS